MRKKNKILTDLEDYVRMLEDLNKKQGIMIMRRNKVIESIFEDAHEAAKGTVLSNVKRKCVVFFKDRMKGK